MKKLAIIGALVLAIGASVTAGTMAKYTQTLDAKTSVVTAKKFVIDQTIEAKDVKIAPGETFEWEFSVDNSKGNDVSEVGIDLDIAIKHKDYNDDSLLGQIGDIKVIDMNSNKEVQIKENENGTILLDQKFTAGVKETKKYKIILDWPYEMKFPNGEVFEEMDIYDTEEQGNSTSLTVEIKGVQVKPADK